MPPVPRMSKLLLKFLSSQSNSMICIDAVEGEDRGNTWDPSRPVWKATA